MVVQGGRTKDFSEKIRQHLSSVVEIFDPFSESWEQSPVTGDAPSPGTQRAATASLHDDLFSFGGFDGSRRFNTLHILDTEKLCSQVSPQNADGAPMPKSGCGMIAFANGLGVFGGYGVPRGPTEPKPGNGSGCPGSLPSSEHLPLLPPYPPKPRLHQAPGSPRHRQWHRCLQLQEITWCPRKTGVSAGEWHHHGRTARL